MSFWKRRYGAAWLSVAVWLTAAPASAQGAIAPPVLKTFVEAEYPARAREARQEADVVLELVIDAKGAVSSAKVLEPAAPDLDEAALAAARKFVFEPARNGGVPVPVRLTYRYSFRLAQSTDATLEGELVDRRSRAPVAGATVRTDTGQEALTDAAGRFRFEHVTPGERTLTFSGGGLATPLSATESVAAGAELSLAYEADLPRPTEPSDPDDMEIVVTGPPEERAVVRTRIDAQTARNLPGTQGDVLKVVQSLPGVTRPAAGSGQIIVWGASPDDTRVYVGGVRVPRLYHEAGIRSVLPSEMIDSVTLVPGAYGASYGRGLGGLVLVTPRRLDEEKVHGTIAADFLDAGANVRGGKGPWRFEAGGRVSYLDALFSSFVSEETRDAYPLPRYHDAQARLTYSLAPGHTLEVGGLLSGDVVSRGLVREDPSRRRREDRTDGFERVYVRYHGSSGSGEAVSVVGWAGAERSSLLRAFGAVPTELSSTDAAGGLRASWRGRAASNLAVTAGLDAEIDALSVTRRGSVLDPPREGDLRLFGQPPSDSVNADDWKVTQVGLAPYVELDWAVLGGAVHVMPGLRFDPYMRSVSRKTPREGDTPSVGAFAQDAQLEPRLALSWEAHPSLTVHAAGSVLSRPTPATDLSAVFGNPALPLARGLHATVGAEAHAGPFTVETTLFVTSSSQLPVRNTKTAPALTESLVATGEGRSYGVQAVLRLAPTKNVQGWITYTVQRSERRDSASRAFRLADVDQSHGLTAVASWEPGAGFTLGLRARFTTGYPRTPVRGSYYDGSRDLSQPIYGTLNTERLPLFFQLDVRASKRFTLGPGELEAYVEVLNATAQANAEEIVYNDDLSQKGYLTGLPILPLVGARWSW